MKASSDAHMSTMSMVAVSTSSGGATGEPGPSAYPSPEFVSVGTADTSAAATTTPSYPTSVVDGDTLVAVIFGIPTSSLESNLPPAPAGWSQRFTEQMRAVDALGAMALYTKTADGTETGTESFTGTGSFVGTIMAVTGASFIQFDVSYHDGALSGNGPTLVTTADDSMLIDIPMTWGNSDVAVSTGTQRQTFNGDGSMAIGTRPVTAASQSQAACTWTNSNSIRCIISLEVVGTGPIRSFTLDEAIDALTPVMWTKLGGLSAAALTNHGSDSTVPTNSGVLFDDQVGPDSINYATFGAGEYVAFGTDAAYKLGAERTFILAVYPTTLDASAVTWNAGDNGGAGRELLLYHNSGDMRCLTYQEGSATVYTQKYYPDGLTLNEWNLIVITFGASEDMTYYVNSKTAGTATDELGPTGTAATNSEALRIGRWAEIAGYEWIGALAHAAIVDRVLTADEVTDIFNGAFTEGWTP